METIEEEILRLRKENARLRASEGPPKAKPKVARVTSKKAARYSVKAHREAIDNGILRGVGNRQREFQREHADSDRPAWEYRAGMDNLFKQYERAADRLLRESVRKEEIANAEADKELMSTSNKNYLVGRYGMGGSRK